MWVRFASSGLALLLTLTLGAVTHAQDDRERARAEFQRGVEAFGRDDFQVALDAFQEAYRLAPHPAVRVNIANCYERLNRPLEALFHFEHFLSEAERPTAQQRREVQSAIDRLERLVGHIQLQITPDGAMATLDGGETRRAPVVQPVRVTAGSHTLEVRMDGYATHRQTIEVQGGQTARIAVRLDRATVASAATEPAAATVTEPAPETTTETTAVATTETTITTTVPEEPVQPAEGGGGFVLAPATIIAGAITIAAGIGAGVTGGLALAADSDFNGQVAIYEDPASTPAVREQARIDGEAAASNASTLALVTDVLLVTTIVGAGATVFFLITTQDGGMLGDSGESDSASASGVQMVAVPIVTGDVAGAAIVGTF